MATSAPIPDVSLSVDGPDLSTPPAHREVQGALATGGFQPTFGRVMHPEIAANTRPDFNVLDVVNDCCLKPVHLFGTTGTMPIAEQAPPRSSPVPAR
jgi:hypothetical protein